MKFFVFWEKWIYFQNKNILFRYKNLLNDLFHNIFWLQKVYHESKKRAAPPILEGFEQKLCQRAISFILFWGKVFILLIHESSSKIMKLFLLKPIPFDFPFPQILFFSDFRFPHKIRKRKILLHYS